MTLDLESVIKTYVTLRDQQAAMSARHREEMEPLNRDMQDIEAALAAVMDEQKVDKLGTNFGTAYFSETTSCTVDDREAFFDFVFENQRRDLLEARVSKTAFLETGGDAPGVKVSRSRRVNVRRA